MRIIAHVSALRPMKDSVNWQAIPTNTPMVAGYVPPSSFAWPAAAWARFPNAIKVRITPSAATKGLGIQVLDVEPGDATAAQAPGWAEAQRALGQEPTIYCSASNWQSLINAFNAARVPQPQYWIAAYPGDGQALPTLDGITAVAHQFADPATSGGDWDSSVVAPFWPGVDDSGVIDLTPEQDAILRDIREQLCGQGCRAPGQFTGWSQLGNHTLTDGVAIIGDGINANFAAERSAVAGIASQVGAVQAAISNEEADLLAAVRSVPAAQVDPTALAAALESAGLPNAVVAALLAVVSKAAA